MAYTFKEITREETKHFILELHYAKRMPSVSFAFGVFDGNSLLGILTIGKPASNALCIGVCGKEYSSKVYELNRLCLLDNTPKNLASQLISYALKSLKPLNLIIVSYADTAINHTGYIYQASNFLYTGMTKKRTDKFTNGKHSRHYDKEAKEVYRVVRSAKHRYIFFTGSKTFKKEMHKHLNYTIAPYPKMASGRYELGTKLEQEIIKVGG